MKRINSYAKIIIGIILAVCVIVAAGCGIFSMTRTPAVETATVESDLFDDETSDPEGSGSLAEPTPKPSAQPQGKNPDEETQQNVSQAPGTTKFPSGNSAGTYGTMTGAGTASVQPAVPTATAQPAYSDSTSQPSASDSSSENTNSAPRPEGSTPAPTATPIPTPSGDETLQMQQGMLTMEVGMSYSLLTEESSPENVTWQNSNASIADVSKVGTVTALAPGQTRITASRDGVQSTCTVTVTEPAVSLNITQLDLQPGQTASLTLQGTTQTPTWYSSETSVATVGEDGLVTAISFGRSVVYAQIAGRSFACEVRCVQDDIQSGTALTRGEWIADLLDYLGVSVLTEDDLTVPSAGTDGNTIYYYCDTQGTPYGLAAETARLAGILPMDEDAQDVPAFSAQAPATREFVAVTLMRAAGFSTEGVEPPVCTDVAELKYPEYVSLAVSQGFLSLTEDNRFCPQNSVFQEQEAVFWQILDTLQASTEVTKTVEQIDYAADAIPLETENGFQYTVEPVSDEAGTYRVLLYNYTEPVYEDNVLVLPVSEAYPGGYAIKVTEVLEQKDNSVTVLGVVPQDLAEVVDHLHFEGVGTADVANIQKLLPDDQLTISYDPNGSIDTAEATGYARAAARSVALADTRFSVAVPGKLTFDFGEGIKLGEKGKLKGSVEVTIPDITAVVDVDAGLFSGVKLNEVTFSITKKSALKGKLSYTATKSEVTAEGTNEKLADSIELGRIPIQFGATPFSLDLVFSLYWDVNGKVEIVYTLEETQGFQIKDGVFRDLKKVTQELELPTVEGSAEIGIKGAANLTFCSIWDLLGADMKVGPKVTASLTVREAKNLICINAAAFLTGKIELNPDTLAGDLLKNVWHYTLEHVFWDQYNSPFSMYLHFESPIIPMEFQKVPHCTDDPGSVDGYIFDENNAPVHDARVIVNENGGRNTEMGRIYTDDTGYYKIEDLPEGQYSMCISKNGYQTFDAEVTISAGACTQMDDIILIRRDQQGDGKVSGTATNAVTGTTLNTVNYIAYTGYNITEDSAVVDRGSVSGNYEITLPAGNYTLEFFADGYARTSVNVAVSVGHKTTANVVLSPESTTIGASNIRIVLTWGSQPRDLDSHLFGPNGNGGTFHTYYGQKTYGSTVALDRDDTTSYGPETTTVSQISDSGVYSFYVHDFTNRSSSNSTALSNSDAKIEIYFNNVLYARLNISSNRGGTVWHVFDYDASSDTFQIVNEMYYASNPGTLGVQRSLMQRTGSVSVQEALVAIAREEEKEAEDASAVPAPAQESQVTVTSAPAEESGETTTPAPGEDSEVTVTPAPGEEAEVTVTPAPAEESQETVTPAPTEESPATGTPSPEVEEKSAGIDPAEMLAPEESQAAA